MSKMTCVEAIYEVLVEKYGIETDSECFEDVLFGCCAAAFGDITSGEVPEWLATRDLERDVAAVCLDIVSYFRECGIRAVPSEVIAEATAAGRAAL